MLASTTWEYTEFEGGNRYTYRFTFPSSIGNNTQVNFRELENGVIKSTATITYNAATGEIVGQPAYFLLVNNTFLFTDEYVFTKVSSGSGIPGTWYGDDGAVDYTLEIKSNGSFTATAEYGHNTDTYSGRFTSMSNGLLYVGNEPVCYYDGTNLFEVSELTKAN